VLLRADRSIPARPFADVESGDAIKSHEDGSGSLKTRIRSTIDSTVASLTATAKEVVVATKAFLKEHYVAIPILIIICFLFCPLLGKLSRPFLALKWRAWFTLGVVISLFFVLALNMLPTHVAFAFALGLLILFECIDEKGALQGFSNKGAWRFRHLLCTMLCYVRIVGGLPAIDVMRSSLRCAALRGAMLRCAALSLSLNFRSRLLSTPAQRCKHGCHPVHRGLRGHSHERHEPHLP
jgi:hypothetical protein